MVLTYSFRPKSKGASLRSVPDRPASRARAGTLRELI